MSNPLSNPNQNLYNNNQYNIPPMYQPNLSQINSRNPPMLGYSMQNQNFNPNLSFPGMNPYDMNNSFNRSFNPYQSQFNPRFDLSQLPNMADIIANDYELQRNQYEKENNEEIDDMQYKTKLIRKGLNEGLDTESEIESREKRQKRLLKYKNDNIFNPEIPIYVPRSEYFYDRDRYFIELLLMKPLKTNGNLGTKIVTDFHKETLIENNNFVPQDYIQLNDEDEYFERAIKDGIYLDYIKQLIFSYNIQKSEQRAAREEKKEWFTLNGDMKMDNDIFSDVITKPLDISLSHNEKFDTFTASQDLKENEKLKIFKLKVIISKIIFTNLPLFSQEDVLCSEVKKFHKEFYTMLNRLNIPYLKEKITIISQKMEELNNLRQKTEAQEKELKNMKIFLDESAQYLSDEKSNLNAKAQQIYNKWKELKRIRESQKYQNTKLKLNVLRFNSNEINPNIYDYAFILTNPEIQSDDSLIPKNEIQRREKIKDLQCYLKVYINGIYAFETKHMFIQWPSFEVEFNQKFLINLYTRPTKFEIELYLNNELVKKFQAEPPGIFSKTVTSSASLDEVVEFGNEEEREKEKLEKKKKKKIPESLKEKQEEEEGEEEKQNLLENEEKNVDEKKISDNYTGELLIKTEWEGRAPDLPPTKMEDKLELVNKQLDFKEEIRQYNEFDYPFDVNDPRNVAFIEDMKKGRLQMMLKFMYKEYLLNYYDVHSTRHYLLLQRLKKESLSKFTFPILESQILKNEECKNLLNELRKEDNIKLIDEDETNKMIKDALEKLRQQYSDKIILTDDEYLQLQKEKIKIMKKDIVKTNSYNYSQIISEPEIYDNPALLIKEFFIRVFTIQRKLQIKRQVNPPVKVESLDKIKINIHIVKGYNIPIRISSAPSKDVDQKKIYLSKRQRFNNPIFIDPRLQSYGSMNNSGYVNNDYISNGSINLNASGIGGGMPGFPGMGPYGMGGFQPGLSGRNPNVRDNMSSSGIGGTQFYGNLNNSMPNAAALTKIQFLQELEKKVNSFIEVKIQYYDQEGVFRTDAIDSIHPDYNHQIEWVIKPKNGAKYFTREELSKCPGVFYFSLYDEVRRDTLVKAKDANTFIQRFEKKYLGSFNIPFATLFQNASILDTICKVDIPKTVFGYYSDTTSILDVNNDNVEEEQKENLNTSMNINDLSKIPRIVNPFLNSYVSLYMTLDPIPSFSKNDELDYVPGFEDSLFLINGTSWLKNIKDSSLLKNRTIRLFCENFDGQSVFIPRYLRKDGQKPDTLIFTENPNPDYNYDNDEDNAIERAARYVRLIPFIEDNQTWDYAEEMPDCWCTDNEFLELGFGDYEEHAVLLCNYFNYIDRVKRTGCISYLVLGDAHPEGSTTYVIRLNEDHKQVELWNAKTGDCFFFDKTIEENKFLCLTVSKQYKFTKANSETICQLKSIGAIATFDNIYVNIQKESDPGLIEFDLDNPNNWKPFLTEAGKNKYFPHGIQTVQKDIEYQQPNEQAGLQLKEKIKEYLKQEIEKVRSEIIYNERPLVTNWELTSPPKIEKTLEKYEMFCFNIKNSGINWKKNNKDIKQERKIEQDNQLKELLNFGEEIRSNFLRKEIYGFPINLSFTTLREIWEQLKLTNVHLIGGDNSELCLSVYVNPLPSNVNSVWIFFAILQNLDI